MQYTCNYKFEAELKATSFSHNDHGQVVHICASITKYNFILALAKYQKAHSKCVNVYNVKCVGDSNTSYLRTYTNLQILYYQITST